MMHLTFFRTLRAFPVISGACAIIAVVVNADRMRACEAGRVIHIDHINFTDDLRSAVSSLRSASVGNTEICCVDGANFLNVLITSINVCNTSTKSIIFFTDLINRHINLLVSKPAKTRSSI